MKISKMVIIILVIGIIVLSGVVSYFVFSGFREGINITVLGMFKTEDKVDEINGHQDQEEEFINDYEITNKIEWKSDINLEMTFFNTSGTSVLLKEGKNYALIDSSTEAGSDDIIEYFRENNIKKLRYFVITNYHPTSIEGAKKILTYIPVDYIILSQNMKTDKKGDSLREFLSDSKLVWTSPLESTRYVLGKSVFDLIPTHSGGSYSTYILNGSNKYLLTGDITRVDAETIQHLPEELDMYAISTRQKTYTLPLSVVDHFKVKTVVIGDLKSHPIGIGITDKIQANGEALYKVSGCNRLIVKSNGVDTEYSCEKN